MVYFVGIMGWNVKKKCIYCFKEFRSDYLRKYLEKCVNKENKENVDFDNSFEVRERFVDFNKVLENNWLKEFSVNFLDCFKCKYC